MWMSWLLGAALTVSGALVPAQVASAAETEARTEVHPTSAATGAPRETTREAGQLVPNVGKGDFVEELPRDLQGLEVDEKQGAEVPRSLTFRDDTGAPVVLGSYLDRELPIILTFNYSSCPMLCSVQLDVLVQSLQKMKWRVGRQFRIITVSLDSAETPEIAARTKERYVSLFPEADREQVRAGWHFLTGDQSAVAALTDAVGFRYRYVARSKEYVHPATLIFLSPWGTVTRYFHGIGYVPEQLDTSIFQAGAGEHGVSLGFLLACFVHDPDADSHAKTGQNVMRYGALGFAALFLGGLGAWHYTRSRKSRTTKPEVMPDDEALSKRGKGNEDP
jgi:protein SCO1/2